MAITITFNEDIESKGWTSFHSYEPDELIRLKNSMFSVKDGQLWVHEHPDIPKNLFYGVQYDSWVEAIINDGGSDVKVFKNVNTESTTAWKAELTTNLTTGVIESSEFLEMEGEFYAHTRQNEDTLDLSSDSSIRGIGTLSSISSLVLTFPVVPDGIGVGDGVYKYDAGGDTVILIGTCTAYDGTTVTVDAVLSTPVPTDFIMAIKNPRIESSEIRGYYMMVKLTSIGSEDSEIYAVNSEVFKSYD